VFRQPLNGSGTPKTNSHPAVNHHFEVLTTPTLYPVLEITVGHWPFSSLGQPKSILVGQFYCTLSMGWQSITYKMSYLQKMINQFLTLISTTATHI